MKAEIRISGQISGNFTLARKMRNYNEMRNGMFNSFVLTYSTIGEAKEDLKNAYRSLCDEVPELKGKMSGVRKFNDNSALYYDASKAEVLPVSSR